MVNRSICRRYRSFQSLVERRTESVTSMNISVSEFHIAGLYEKLRVHSS